MVSAQQDAQTADVTLANELIRVTFRRGTPRFGLFPLGYTGYDVDAMKDGAWVRVGDTPYFSCYCYRSGWGRDWLHYVVPKTVELTNEPDCARVVFTESQADLDRVPWHFGFAFELHADEPIVHVTYTARVDAPREVLLFQGPRFHVGQGAFGARKDEALLPGVEYLQAAERSSAMDALAPDAQLNFAPHPAKVTLPLMTVVCDGVAAGLMWDPRQSYYDGHEGPAAAFASPNWIEGQDNHLLSLYLPGIPDFVPENGFRAHTPLPLAANGTLTLETGIFAVPAEHATDAVDLWLRTRGGLPAPVMPPHDPRAYANELVRILCDDVWDGEARGWPWEYGGKTSAHPAVATALAKALPIVDNPELAQRVRERVQGVAETSAYLPLSFRDGDLARAIAVQAESARAIIDSQNEDGSWGYKQTEIAEGGLAGLMGPPRPGYIAAEGARSQGITAAKAADLMSYALLTGDEEALACGLRGIEDMNRYAVPYVYENNECPPSPSLHGAYTGLRACLIAYRITGDPKRLEEAAYWARTGLPFVYLWSFGEREVVTGQVHASERIFVEGSTLYGDTTRDPMLYGALYGYGSSQYMHHWYGLLVHWIGLKYAEDLASLAPHETSLPWRTVAEGLVTSGMWQTFDAPPFAGYFPDAFSVERWTPSGPAFSPAALLDTMLHVNFGIADCETVIVRDGAGCYHVTSSVAVRNAGVENGVLRFDVEDPGCRRLQIVVSGLADAVQPSVDGSALPRASEPGESSEEHWMRTPQGLTLVRVLETGRPRRLEFGLE